MQTTAETPAAVIVGPQVLLAGVAVASARLSIALVRLAAMLVVVVVVVVRVRVTAEVTKLDICAIIVAYGQRRGSLYLAKSIVPY